MREFYHSYTNMHPLVRLLLVGTIFMFIGTSMSLPFLAVYLVNKTQMSSGIVGTIIGSGSLAGMFGGILGGILSDKIGKGRLLIGSLFISAFVFVGYGLVDKIWILFIIVMIGGLSNAVFSTLSRAAISDLTEKKIRGNAFSLLNFCLNIGWGIGPLIGVAFGFTATPIPFFITALIFFLYGIILLVKMRSWKDIESEEKADKFNLKVSLRVVSKDSTLFLYLVAGVIFFAAWTPFTVLLSQYLLKEHSNGTTIFSVMLAINSVVIVLLQLPISNWITKKSFVYQLTTGISLLSLSLLGFGHSPSAIYLYISMFIFSIAEAIVMPLMSNILDEISPSNMKGTYFGLQNITVIGVFLNPVMGGFILDKWGGATVYTILGICGFISLVVFTLCMKQYESKRERKYSILSV